MAYGQAGLSFSFPHWSLNKAVSLSDCEVHAVGNGESILKQNWSQDLDELSDFDEPEVDAEEQDHPSGDNFESAKNVKEQHPAANEQKGFLRQPVSKVAALGASGLAHLPMSLLSKVANHLSGKDIASALSTCSAWRTAFLADEVWEASAHSWRPAGVSTSVHPVQAGHEEAKQPSQPELQTQRQANGVIVIRRGPRQDSLTEQLLPKLRETSAKTAQLLNMHTRAQPAGTQYLLAKCLAVAERGGSRFMTLKQPHDDMRIGLCALWLQQEACDLGPLQRSILKLTRLNWQWTYEALAAGFTQAADFCALYIKATGPHLPYSPSAHASQDQAGRRSVWEAVLQAWGLYSAWLNRVVSASRMLSQEVLRERNAEMHTRGRFDTPTLVDVGKAAFRSQVVLAYGLRLPLADALHAAARAKSQDAAACPAWLLDAGRLLHVLDVMDDATAPTRTHTQGKLRREFGMDPEVGWLRRNGRSGQSRRRSS